MTPRLGDRKRPRVRSYRLRPIWWVVAREAYLRVIFWDQPHMVTRHTPRQLLLGTRVDRLRSHAHRLMLLTPSSRIWRHELPATPEPPPTTR